MYNVFPVFLLAVISMACSNLKRNVRARNEDIQKGIELKGVQL